MQEPLISIILPIHERYEYLEECIRSILNQTIDSIEILCIFDGKCDKSQKIIEKYNCNKVNIIAKKKEGAWASRNLGIEIAKGEYVCFMDSDDYYASEDALEKLYVAAKENNALICGGNINNVYEDRKAESRGEVFELHGFITNSRRPQMYGHTRYIYKRIFLLDERLNNCKLRRFEDPPFVLKTFVRAENYYVIEKVIYNCRQYERTDYYDYLTIVDILKGIKYCVDFLKNVSYRERYKVYIVDALKSVYFQYVCYLGNGDKKIEKIITGIRNDVENIGYKMYGKTDCVGAKELIKNKMYLINRIAQSKKISLYGTGGVASCLINSRLIVVSKIQSCHNTKVTQKDIFFEGIRVESINDFNSQKSDLLIVAADGEKAVEMIGALVNLGIDNYISISSDDVYFMKQIIRICKKGDFFEKA